MCIYLHNNIEKNKTQIRTQRTEKQQEYTKNTKWIIRKQHLIIKI